jgi:hypothetical protein
MSQAEVRTIEWRMQKSEVLELHDTLNQGRITRPHFSPSAFLNHYSIVRISVGKRHQKKGPRNGAPEQLLTKSNLEKALDLAGLGIHIYTAVGGVTACAGHKADSAGNRNHEARALVSENIADTQAPAARYAF